MKILIIGKDSYIGNHIDQWLSGKGWKVDQLDVLKDEWKSFDFSTYDALVHVAGIVHRPDCNDKDLYKRVNTDLPIQIAKKAKEQHVKTFLFLSTMAVFGMKKRLKKNVITTDTKENPKGLYGASKRNAEIGLLNLQDKHFNIIIIRPPNVYGKGCKGGYITGFLSVVRKLPVIPYAYNNVKQSMLFIDNLSELVKLAIQNNLNGILMPQDDRAVSANEITRVMAIAIGKKPKTSVLLGLFVRLFHFIPLVNKAYGGLEYDMSLSQIEKIDYVVKTFDEGMALTIK